MATIQLDNASLTFTIRKYNRTTLKDFVISKLTGKTMNTSKEVHALENISFSIKDGEKVGILGHNGAGKSTLLRLIAGIYPPTAGTRHVEGQINSLFDLSLGFDPAANGWENIAFRGYLQGETPATIRAKTKAIAEFSELGDFLDMPVRCYSSGMRVRLAFSIATAMDPQILLIDEVLGVGDRGFQKKARERMQEMMAKAKLIVIVSHDMDSLANLCDRALWLDNGHIRMMGPTAQVVQEYNAQPDTKLYIRLHAARRAGRKRPFQAA